jgi:hypothetical protein
VTAHIVNKIAEVDPTPSKEYTDRMLHWYMRSSDYPRGTGVHGDSYRGIPGSSKSESDVMRSEIGGYGMTLPDWYDPVKQEEYVQKGLKIHAEQKEAKETIKEKSKEIIKEKKHTKESKVVFDEETESNDFLKI